MNHVPDSQPGALDSGKLYSVGCLTFALINDLIK